MWSTEHIILPCWPGLFSPLFYRGPRTHWQNALALLPNFRVEGPQPFVRAITRHRLHIVDLVLEKWIETKRIITLVYITSQILALSTLLIFSLYRSRLITLAHRGNSILIAIATFEGIPASSKLWFLKRETRMRSKNGMSLAYNPWSSRKFALWSHFISTI